MPLSDQAQKTAVKVFQEQTEAEAWWQQWPVDGIEKELFYGLGF
jgi:uncharacterized protein (DUF2384 family)